MPDRANHFTQPDDDANAIEKRQKGVQVYHVLLVVGREVCRQNRPVGGGILGQGLKAARPRASADRPPSLVDGKAGGCGSSGDGLQLGCPKSGRAVAPSHANPLRALVSASQVSPSHTFFRPSNVVSSSARSRTLETSLEIALRGFLSAWRSSCRVHPAFGDTHQRSPPCQPPEACSSWSSTSTTAWSPRLRYSATIA